MNRKKIYIACAISVVTIIGIYAFLNKHENSEQAGGFGGKGGRPMPVKTAIAEKGDIDATVSALGTVTALNTATVKARVDGQLIKIYFKDGQQVKEGEVLAQIDPRPYQAAWEQSLGQLQRDKALLTNARLDLERYKMLQKKDSIASQQVDTQAALVEQYEGAVKTDQGIADANKLNLDFTKITAPISGRLGLRQLDIGNMIHGNDANGLVVITQSQPIYVVFAIPSDKFSDILEQQLNGKQKLVVDALDRDARRTISQGQLYSVDNQIDLTTSTVKAKAEFINKDNKLFPNQFVNVRVHVQTLHDTTLVPSAAIQRGAQGTFMYVVDQDNKVSSRPVKLGPFSGDKVAVIEGLEPAEQVVIDGADKLRNGASVIVSLGKPNEKKGSDKNTGESAPVASQTMTTKPASAEQK
jgi:membrane fusion protein, multidrug efflux system